MDLRKKSKSELIELFQKHGFKKQTGPSDDGSGYWHLLSKEVKAFSTETVQKVEALLASKQAAIKKVESIKLGDLERTKKLDITYSILRPTHNMRNFYLSLQQACRCT